MTDFKKHSKFDGARKGFNKGGFGRPPFGSRASAGRDNGFKQLYDAECNSCHKMCQVPFRPNGLKPIYCRDCFRQDEERAPKGRFEKREYGAPRPFARETPSADSRRLDDVTRRLDAMQATLEKIYAAIETGNRAAALSKELGKYATAEKPEKPEKKKTKKA